MGENGVSEESAVRVKCGRSALQIFRTGKMSEQGRSFLKNAEMEFGDGVCFCLFLSMAEG